MYRNVTDKLGSVRLVVRADTGDVVQRIDYDEFDRIPPSGDTNSGFQPFGFAGGLYDEDTALVRFGARDYDPLTGRWTSKEPLGFAGSGNFYRYAGNDPVNYLDRNGLWLESAWDFTSLCLGADSFGSNLGAGNYWSAVLDAGGMIADGAALALPVIPGGVGAARKAAQEAAEHADDIADAGRGILKKCSQNASDGAGAGKKIPNSDLNAPPPARGKAPIGNDGHPVELHHPGQQPSGPSKR